MITDAPVSNPVTKAEILIVEDEFIIADNLRKTIRQLGYGVKGIAHTMARALELLAEYDETGTPPDLVLLDIRLKGELDGIRIAQHMRKKHDIPFIFITSFADEHVLDMAKATEPYGYVVKPFKIDDIRVAVEIALYKHAYHSISRQEQEKQVLLSLSEAIATVRDKEDLFRIIHEQIGPLFNFTVAAIAFLAENATHNLYLLDTTAPVRENVKQYRSNSRYPIDEGFMNQLLSSREPHSFVITEQAACYLEGELLALIGQHMVAVTLRYQQAPIGVLLLDTQQEQSAASSFFPLLKAISDQVAVAVANILANEEILEREREKTLLIEITNVLTKQPTWDLKVEALLTLINAVIPWQHFSLMLDTPTFRREFNYAQTAQGIYTSLNPRDLLEGTDLELAALRQFKEAMRPLYLTAGCYLGADYQELRQTYPYAEQVHNRYGIQSCLIVPLTIASGQPGDCVLILESADPSGFDGRNLGLLQRLAPQIGLVLEKLLAVEDIQRREEETALQLAVNNMLVSCKDRNELFSTLAREINRVVTTKLLLVQVLQPGRGVRYRVLLERQHVLTFLVIDEVTDEVPPVEISLAKDVSDPPGVYVGSSFEAWSEQSLLYQHALRQYGLRSLLCLGFPLSHGLSAQVVIADTIPFAYMESDLALLGRLTPQISLALDNLLAFEQILSLQKQLEGEKAYLEEEIKVSYNFEEIVGQSQTLEAVFAQINQVAPSDTTVLIEGETGTGKELVARAIHNRSTRQNRVLIKVNCATLPAQLIESELFGHERGAFTGAHERRIGKFELADGGTIFLDEVGEIPLELQAKLLRVLQEKEFERVGGKGVQKTDVRIICATNRDLEAEVKAGRFRPDLYYRLAVFPLKLPPLRERRDDIPHLALHFAHKYARKMGKRIKSVSRAAINELMAYRWPGNVRELEHIIERSVVLSGGPILELANPLNRPSVQPLPGFKEPGVQSLKQAERELIIRVLQQTGGRIRGVAGAAQILDIEPTTLEARMKKLGIIKKHIVE